MIVIIGASASGKTEISKILQNNFNYKKCITTTTRPMRTGEVNDVDYHFIQKENFIERISNNEFVEYAIYNDNYYGINKKDISNNLIVVVEPQGANSLVDEMANDIFIVYIETSKDLRKMRMIDRGDKLELIEKRLFLDEEVFKIENIKKIDLHISNEDHDLFDLAVIINKKYIEFQKERESQL